MKRESENIKQLLDEKSHLYNNVRFIEQDPISIPHRFSMKEDIEISAFLTATISWGNRKSIIGNAGRLMHLMDNSPFDFILGYSEKDLYALEKFVHRTFNGTDCTFFIRSLRNLYVNHGGLEGSFSCNGNADAGLSQRIAAFRKRFLTIEHSSRSEKHLSDPDSGSACKRLCMFLRWMVRNDKAGVDFGIWKTLSPSELMLPLDVHTARVSRHLGILKRKSNDWNSVREVTLILRSFDPGDPVKYDFALFGMGVERTLDPLPSVTAPKGN